MYWIKATNIWNTGLRGANRRDARRKMTSKIAQD